MEGEWLVGRRFIARGYVGGTLVRRGLVRIDGDEASMRTAVILK